MTKIELLHVLTLNVGYTHFVKEYFSCRITILSSTKIKDITRCCSHVFGNVSGY